MRAGLCVILAGMMLTGCGATATWFDFEKKTVKCKWFESCEEKDVYIKIPTGQAKCRGVGCTAQRGEYEKIEGSGVSLFEGMELKK